MENNIKGSIDFYKFVSKRIFDTKLNIYNELSEQNDQTEKDDQKSCGNVLSVINALEGTIDTIFFGICIGVEDRDLYDTIMAVVDRSNSDKLGRGTTGITEDQVMALNLSKQFMDNIYEECENREDDSDGE